MSTDNTSTISRNPSNPKLSVVMSVYNGLPFLRESVESVLSQTFTDFEFIVIDDCSTDSTWEILTEYASKDDRIVLIQNKENLGLTKSLNVGLKAARGEYIARQDADDVSLPNRFEKQVAFIDKNSDVTLVSCNLEMIDSQGKTEYLFQVACDSNLVSWYLLFYNYIGGHSQVLFRRKPVIEIGGYSENYRYTQDYELWCRLTHLGKIAILPDTLLKHRIHNQRISTNKKVEQEAYLFDRIRKNVEELIDGSSSESEAVSLYRFWTGNLWNSYPDISEVRNISSKMKKIYQAYLKKRISADEIALPKQLQSLTAKQFYDWFLSKEFKAQVSSNPGLKLKFIFCALQWHPNLILNHYMAVAKSRFSCLLSKAKNRLMYLPILR